MVSPTAWLPTIAGVAIQDAGAPAGPGPSGAIATPPAGLPPLHQLDFPHSTRIGGTAFSPDGEVLYVQLFPEVIDIWEVLVYHWPEVLGGLTALVALVLLVLAARILRRPQRRGEPHCRRCNYNLSGLAPADPAAAGAGRYCPECGTDPEKRRPRTGRTTRRRLAPVLAPLLIVVVGYSAMLAAGLPRQGRASVWLSWPSVWATEQITKHGMVRLAPFIGQHERIIALDPATGRIIRTVASRSTPTYYPLSLSPDGEWLLLSGGPTALERVSARNGSVRGIVPIGGQDSLRRMGGRDVVGYAPDGRTAYVVHADAATVKTRIVAWNLETDEVTPVFETDAYAATGGRQRTEARRAVLIPGDRPRFAVVPSFTEAYNTNQYTIWIHDAATGEIVREVPVDGDHLSLEFPVVTPDGARLFLSNMSNGILGIDLQTGEALGTVRPESHMDTGREDLLLSPSGELLFLPVFRDTVLVRSLPDRRWIARLSTAGLIGPDLAASSCGRWLSLVGFKPGGGAGGPYLHELLIYDISEIGPVPLPSTAPGPDDPDAASTSEADAR